MFKEAVVRLIADAILPLVCGIVAYFCNGSHIEIFFAILIGYATTLLQDIRP